MSTLLLVRHAQASFFAENYDQLSPLGERQATKLGEYFAERRMRFDEVYVGPASRHIRSAELVGDCIRAAGLPWPEPTVSEALHEHAADTLLQQFVNNPTDCPPELRQLAAEYQSATAKADVQKGFQKLFEALVTLWTEDRIDSTQIGSWQSFRQRVDRALHSMTDGKPSGSRILAFSSTGPITVALQSVLQTADQTALQTGWRLRNCSMTRFLFGNGRITLDAFNDLSHLNADELITYR